VNMMNTWTLLLVIFAVLTAAQHVSSQPGELKLASVRHIYHASLRDKKVARPNTHASFLFIFTINFYLPQSRIIAIEETSCLHCFTVSPILVSTKFPTPSFSQPWMRYVETNEAGSNRNQNFPDIG